MDRKFLLPLLILVITISGKFIFQSHLDGFERFAHGFLSSHAMTMAHNLNEENYFFLYESVSLAEDKTIYKHPYTRFSPVPIYLIHFVTKDILTLKDKIFAARQLMNVFYVLAMLFAYLGLTRITQRPNVSAMSVLFSFSATIPLFYSDMIFNETPALCGCFLFFYCASLYESQHNTKALYLGAVLSLLLGWQPIAFIITLALLSLFRKYKEEKRLRLNSPENKTLLAAVLTSLAVLIFGIYSEAQAIRIPWNQTQIISSMLFRIGLSERPGVPSLSFIDFISKELKRLWPIIAHGGDKESSLLLGLLAGLTCLSLTVYFFLQRQFLLLSLLIFGFVWTFSLRYYSYYHEFQAMYYLGLPLCFFYYLFGRKKDIHFAFLFIGVAIFTLSNMTMNLTKSKKSLEVNVYTEDLQHIRNAISGVKQNVALDGGNNIPGGTVIDGIAEYIALGRYSINFALYDQVLSEVDDANYIISRNPKYNKNPLTPENSFVFLFKK